jgi:hypothetical protein
LDSPDPQEETVLLESMVSLEQKEWQDYQAWVDQENLGKRVTEVLQDYQGYQVKKEWLEMMVWLAYLDRKVPKEFLDCLVSQEQMA